MSSIKEIKNQIENANALGIENLVEKGVIVGGRPTPTGIKPPTTYDIMAAISNIPSSEGGATLNVAFGDTAPDDTGKLWVKAEEPSEITYGSGIDGVLRVNGTSACLRYNSTDPPCAAKIDNKIYIFRDKAVFIYDTNTNAVADLGDILPEALYGSFCYAENNKIYLIGGSTTGNYYVFDPETQKATVFFTTGYDTKIDSGYSKIGNKLFKFGGQSSKDIVLIDLEVNGSGQYLQTQLPVFLRNMCCEAYGKKVYLFGGYGGSSLSNSQYRDKIYAFDTEDYTLRALEITLPEPCDGMCSCRIGTKIYLFGGSTASGRLNKINVFDIEKETIETLEATLLNADTNMGCCGEGTKIYLFGGYAYPETINGFVLTHQLQKGNVEIEASPLKNRFNLINTDNAQVQVGVENVYVGNESNEAELCDAYLYKHFEKLNVDKHFTSEAFQVDSATTLSAAVNCSVGDLVIAAIITRDSLNISDGWTLISTSAVNSTDANGQRLSFAYKYATGENEGITVTQASAQRLYINIVALQGATGFVDNGYSYVDTKAGEVTVEKPEGLTLWGCSANAWSTTSPYGQWKSSNNAYLVDAGTDVQSRLGVFLDQSKVDEVTFTPASSSTLMIVGSLTIQGMDDFCTESLEEWDEWVQVSFGKGDEPAEIENTLKSSEGYLLKDKDGNYLTPKESD